MLDFDDDLDNFSLDDDDSEVDSEWEYESDVDIQDRAGANNDEITDEPEMLMEHDDVDPPLSTTTEDENNEINTLQPEEVASTMTTNSINIINDEANLDTDVNDNDISIATELTR